MRWFRPLALLTSLSLTASVFVGVQPPPVSAATCNGPDGFGYTCADVSRSYITGTTDTGNHGDDVTTVITLPFNFSFYGSSYHNARVSSNGNLQFSGNNAGFGNTTLPNSGFSDTIFALWDDLRTDGAGRGIFTVTTGTAPNRVFTIEWRTVLFSDTSRSARFEIQLEETTNNIFVLYQTVPFDGNSATAGIQGGIGTANRFLKLSENSAQLTNGRVVRYAPGSPPGSLIAPPPGQPIDEPFASSCTLLAATGGSGGRLSTLVRLNPENGSIISTIGPIGYSVTGLAVDARNGDIFASTSFLAPDFPNSILRIDRATGRGTVIGELGVANGAVLGPAADLAMGPPGSPVESTLFGWLESSDDLASIGRNTGGATIRGNSGISTAGSGLAFDSRGTLYFTEVEQDGIRTIDPSNGSVRSTNPLVGINPNGRINALTFDPASGLLFGIRSAAGGGPNAPVSLIAINPDTRVINTRGAAPAGTDAIEFDCTPSRNVRNEDDEERLTPEQKLQRERTNTSNFDDWRTEGNVIAVDCAATPPQLTIANKDGDVVIKLFHDAAKTCRDSLVGLYGEFDGEKIHELLYEAHEASYRRASLPRR